MLVVGTREATADVARFRAMLLLFVERHPRALGLLRPEGMNTDFLHLGNFGQLERDNSLAFRLTQRGVGEQAEGMGKGGAEVPLEGVMEAAPPDHTEAHKHTPRKQLRLCLLVDTWHSARMMMRELTRLSSEHVQVALLTLSVGQLTERQIKAALLAQADMFLCYRAEVGNAKAERHAKERSLPIRKFSVFIDVLELVRGLIEERDKEWKSEREATHRDAYAAAFIPAL